MANERFYQEYQELELAKGNPAVEIIGKDPEFPWVVAIDSTGDHHLLYQRMTDLPDVDFNLALVRKPEFLSAISGGVKPEAIILNANSEEVKISELNSIAPVIVLSGLGDFRDRQIRDYTEEGAYLVRDENCSPAILGAIVKSVYRKNLAGQNDGPSADTTSPIEDKSQNLLLEYNDIKLDLATRQAMLKGEAVDLTTLEWGLMEFFINEPETEISRLRLIGQFWDSNSSNSSKKAARTAIYRLRKKFPGYIQDGPELSYKLESPSIVQS